jgi:hypothetical protein
MSQMYYIFSIKWTKKGDRVATWWREENNGYCYRMDWAGKYTQEQIDAQPDYYNNGDETVAIPCEVVDKLVMQVVEAGSFVNEYIDRAKGKPVDPGVDPNEPAVSVP